jgi:hypothetical protein
VQFRAEGNLHPLLIHLVSLCIATSFDTFAISQVVSQSHGTTAWQGTNTSGPSSFDGCKNFFSFQPYQEPYSKEM